MMTTASYKIKPSITKFILLGCALLLIQQPQLLQTAQSFYAARTAVSIDPTKPMPNVTSFGKRYLAQNNSLEKISRSKPNNQQISKNRFFSYRDNKKIWIRLRNNFRLNHAKDNAHVKFHAEKLKRESKYLQKVSTNASPYLKHIVEQLEKRNMPGELALLPMIESSFNPNARSYMGATGLWQLAASTGKRYGLKQSAWHDPRKDVAAATNAALSYLQFLHGEFDGDWFLALAAYNAGEGRVKRAIKHNLAQNKSTDFWSLPLPKETKNYVPKLLALASLVKHANMHEIEFANLRLMEIPQLAMNKENLAQYQNKPVKT